MQSRLPGVFTAREAMRFSAGENFINSYIYARHKRIAFISASAQ